MRRNVIRHVIRNVTHTNSIPFVSNTILTGGQWKRYKDQLKANVKKCEMELQWENRADDRA